MDDGVGGGGLTMRNPAHDWELTHSSFERTLIEDVLASYAVLETHQDQSAKRNVIRTIFAAVEGLTWRAREQIRELSASMGHLTPLADMAMREQNYLVTEQGQIAEQVRHVTLTASIRLTVRQAQILNDKLEVDFGAAGWSNLRKAIAVRHRVTHPKCPKDLSISSDDLDIAKSAFLWLLAIMNTVIASALHAHSRFNTDMRDLLDALKRGDPAALSDYQDALRDLDAD